MKRLNALPGRSFCSRDQTVCTTSFWRSFLILFPHFKGFEKGLDEPVTGFGFFGGNANPVEDVVVEIETPGIFEVVGFGIKMHLTGFEALSVHFLFRDERGVEVLQEDVTVVIEELFGVVGELLFGVESIVGLVGKIAVDWEKGFKPADVDHPVFVVVGNGFLVHAKSFLREIDLKAALVRENLFPAIKRGVDSFDEYVVRLSVDAAIQAHSWAEGGGGVLGGGRG
jgi:hypothetical protein